MCKVMMRCIIHGVYIRRTNTNSCLFNAVLTCPPQAQSTAAANRWRVILEAAVLVRVSITLLQHTAPVSCCTDNRNGLTGTRNAAELEAPLKWVRVYV